jgi:peptidoglycan hydrolase-like protein with peptidoglycan-binding domain
MKKHLITAVLAASLIAPSATAFAQQAASTSSVQATSSPIQVIPRSNPIQSCISISRTLTRGSMDVNRDGQVTALQNFLRSTGHFSAESTGYFGPLTLQAVTAYQRANGIPATGLVGPLTRASVNAKTCGSTVLPPTVPSNPNQVSNLKVISPKGGETWLRNSVQTISWTDSNVYIQAPKYDVKVQLDLDCKPGQACILLYPIPMTIAKDVMNTSFTWKVGDKLPSTTTFESPMVPDGKYRVFVCPAGNSNQEDLNSCAKSDSYVTIMTSQSGTGY